MSHYEERLEKDLAQISEQLANLGQQVENALNHACLALLTNNAKQAYKVILNDLAINRASRKLDQTCHGFIAIHLPSAGHLRFVSAVMRVNLELERIGDYAVNICRESAQRSHEPKNPAIKSIEELAGKSQHLLSQSITAFNERQIDKAKQNIEISYQLRRTFDTIFKNLATNNSQFEFQDLIIFNSLSRVVDQAKNICEESIFAVTGQTKAAKVYRILFLDEDNSTLAPLAQAIAKKSFPNSATYDSAGRHAAPSINSVLSTFMESHGIALASLSPQTIDPHATELANYHVVVSLQGSIQSYLDSIPFRTIALEWHLECPLSLETTTQFESLYRILSLHIHDLLTSLHGEEAS